MLAHWTVWVPIAILLFLLCWRVWGFGVTHTDDAYWVLRSYTSFFEASDNWAHWQGRLWAYVSGSLIMFALVWQGTVFGELLRLGSFVLFFLAFHGAAAAYCGRRVALLSASLFVALYSLKMDGSILHTYPLITWPAVTACALALLAGRSYALGQGRGWHFGAALGLLLFSLFNNEGVTVTCIAIALLSVAGNAAQGADPRRNRRLLIGFVAVAACYAALYMGWRLLNPTVYNGNTIAPFNLERIVKTLYHFSTSGSALHSLIVPTRLAYGEPFGSGEWISYDAATYLPGVWRSPLAMLAGVLTAWLVWRQLKGGVNSSLSADTGVITQVPGSRKRAVIAGLVLALLPILPVSLVVSYQEWVANLDVRAYSHTVLAYFGWSLVLAACLLRMAGALQARPRARTCVVAALALFLGLVAVFAYRVNDSLAASIRLESGRWAVVNRAIPVNQAVFKSAVLWGPALKPRTQYGGGLHPQYWQEYAKARFGVETEVAERQPDINDLLKGVVHFDHGYDVKARRMVTLFMQYRREHPSGPYRGGRIAVDLAGSNSVASQYVVEFRHGGALQRLPITAFKLVDGQRGVRYIDPPADVDPTSVRLLRADAPADAAPLAVVRLPLGTRIDFRLPRVAQPAVDVTAMLGTGWHAPEAAHIWSRGGTVTLSIPRELIPAGPVRMSVDVASYTSIGFYDGLQKMSARINGQPVGAWDFRLGQTPTVEVDVPELAAGAPLQLEMQVEPGMVAAKLVPGGDNVERGVQLRSIVLMLK